MWSSSPPCERRCNKWDRLMRANINGKHHLTPSVISQLSNSLFTSETTITHTTHNTLLAIVNVFCFDLMIKSERFDDNPNLNECLFDESYYYYFYYSVKLRVQKTYQDRPRQTKRQLNQQQGWNYVKVLSKFMWVAKQTYLCHHRLRRFKLPGRTAVCVSYFPLNTAKFPGAAKSRGKSPRREKQRQRRQSVQHNPLHAQLTSSENIFPQKYFRKIFLQGNSEFIQEARPAHANMCAPCHPQDSNDK